MNNETKQQMINFHKTQIESHQAEIEKLTEQENPKKQKPMFGQALRVEDAKKCLSTYGTVLAFDDDEDKLNQGSLFISKEAAELEVEKRRLRQLARVRMTESWGWFRPLWDGVEWVWCLLDSRMTPVECRNFRTLHFRTKEDAQSFLNEVGQDGIRKILEL